MITPVKDWERDVDRARRSGAYHAASDLLRDGIYPTPTALRRAMRRRGSFGNISAADNAGRRWAFRDAGWHQPKPGAPWQEPKEDKFSL